MLNQNEFQKLADTFGPNIQKWPDVYQSEASAFVSANPDQAEDILAETRNVDDLLELGRQSPGTDMLKARIRASVDANSENLTPDSVRKRSFGYRAMAAVMTLSFVIGFGSAQFAGSGAGSEIEFIAESDLETYADEYGFGELYDWVGVSENAP